MERRREKLLFTPTRRCDPVSPSRTILSPFMRVSGMKYVTQAQEVRSESKLVTRIEYLP